MRSPGIEPGAHRYLVATMDFTTKPQTLLWFLTHYILFYYIYVCALKIFRAGNWEPIGSESWS
jgi:hypothetical protein